jgi:hypothetical protein
MTLAETQALFHGIVSGAAPVGRERIESCFAGSPDLDAEARVAIYADMYLWRLTEALRETFPNLARLLGDERFAALAAAYVRAHPSEHHDVARIGVRLAEYLRAWPDPGRPDLADLAQLEWARQEAFFAPPSTAAGREALSGLSPDGFAAATLKLSPALRVERLRHDAVRLWRRLEEGDPPEPPVEGPAAVAVWRAGFDVFHTLLPGDEAAALLAAGAGEPLERVCELFAGREDPATGAWQALSSWLTEGWIVAVELPAPGG